MDVRRARQQRPQFRSRTGQWLLALLILHHSREVEREWLAALLWPESSAQQAAYNLRRNLTDLRRVLGPDADRLHSPTFRTLRLDLEGAEVDLIAFDAAVARRDADSLEEAVSLYRGPLLEGCAEEWILGEREPREQAYLRALETLAAERMARNDAPAAERHLRRAVACDPLRESVSRALMQSLAEQGEFAAVTRVYRELCKTLHAELNAGPDAQTRALFQTLRARAARGDAAREQKTRRSETTESALSPPRPLAFSLPRPISSFVGRESEVAEVVERLATTRLLTLTGSGGVGKTRLALEVATTLAGGFEDGAGFIDLAALADPALVAPIVARSLGVAEPTGQPAVATLQEFLRDRELLLVLDNCEHLIAECAELAAALLGGCPRLRILATSRQSLGITGEIVWGVPSLSLPPAEVVAAGRGAVAPEDAEATPALTLAERILQYEAVRLFAERGAAVSRAFVLTDQNAAAVAQICRRLDGVPLAIELAAALLRALTVEQLASRLDDRFQLLVGGSRASRPRHQTLRNALDWSHDLLTEPERVLFRRLAIFAGGFTLEAAEAVCAFGAAPGSPLPDPGNNHGSLGAGSREPGAGVLDLLASLVDKSLVRQEAGGRFRLLETIREYALERLREAAEDGGLAARHVAWSVALAEAAETGLHGPDQVAWLARLAAEMDNFRSAMEGCLNRPDGETAGRLAGALARFFHWRGYVTEGRGWLERSLSADGGLSPATRARLLLGAARLCHEQAEAESARRYAAESLALHREMDNSRGVAEALEQLGHILNLQGDHQRGTALFEECLTLSRSVGDPIGTASALNALGYMAWYNEEPERAATLCEESLRLHRELGHRWGIAYSLEFLGLARVAQGDLASATCVLEECLRIRRELEDRRGVAAALMQLGFAAQIGGDAVTAYGYFAESLPLWREVNNPDNAGTVLLGLANVHRMLGEYARSAAYSLESLALFRQIAMPWGIADSLEGLARTAQATGEFQTSLRLAGLAEATRAAGGVPIRDSQRRMYAQLQAAATATLGEAACAAAWAEGQCLSLDQAIAEGQEIAKSAAP
jgi:predicted ATPase/DNA-binding SARP family transcriptional activator